MTRDPNYDDLGPTHEFIELDPVHRARCVVAAFHAPESDCTCDALQDEYDEGHRAGWERGLRQAIEAAEHLRDFFEATDSGVAAPAVQAVVLAIDALLPKEEG